MRLVLLLSGILLAATEPRVTIRVNPRVLMAGAAVRVTCRVPADARNRGLTIAIADYRSSFVQINGEAGPVTSEILFERIPCAAGPAVCDLTDNQGGHEAARLPLEVVGPGC